MNYLLVPYDVWFKETQWVNYPHPRPGSRRKLLCIVKRAYANERQLYLVVSRINEQKEFVVRLFSLI